MPYTFRNIKGDVLDFAELDENYRYTEELFQLTESASNVAVAASNFKGQWASLSGALNMPASVWEAGAYWMLTSNLADVGAAQPGVSSAWKILPLGVGDPAASTHAAASKATPVDADELSFIDSEAGWSLKKLTWANLKAGVRTWLQTQAMTWAALQTFKDIKETVVTASVGASYTVNNANGTLQILTMTANTAFTHPTPTAGKSFTGFYVQDGTGSRIPTWPANTRWPDGVAPTLTTTPGKTDVIGWVADGTYWLGFVGGLKYTRA